MPINVFGGGAVQTAYVSYLSFDLRLGNIVLVWPTSYVNVPYTQGGINYNVLAASMTVTTDNPNPNKITLPNAKESSVGQNFIISNIGAAKFDLLKSDGSTLLSVETGNIHWIQLTDNTTAPGVWQIVHFGTGTSSADAATLAGDGLTALGPLLNTKIPVQTKMVDYPVLPTDRANLIIWKGGEGKITLPTLNTVPSGFYVSFNNEGTGLLSLETTDGSLINALPSPLNVSFQQSLSLISDGTQWWPLGFGQNQFSVVNVLNLDVSGNTNITITPFQSGYIIQEYSGTLTGNITVFFPTIPNNWYISNKTNGNFNLSVQLEGPTGTLYIIPPGTNMIFYSDGTSLFTIPSTLPIPQGGTGSTTRSSAITALMPASITGAIVYFDGTDWVTLPPGTSGQKLTISGNVPVWA